MYVKTFDKKEDLIDNINIKNTSRKSKAKYKGGTN